jgi:hypothetical protein
MGVRRIRDYAYPDATSLEELIEWARLHHYDHMEEGAQSILDIREAIDEAKRYSLMMAD